MIDFAQRIALALAHTDEPRAMRRFEDGGRLLLGFVPLHLRHLHNLLDDISLEIERSRGTSQLVALHQQYDLVQQLFFTALEMHLPAIRGYDGVRIASSDWGVYPIELHRADVIAHQRVTTEQAVHAA
jgi:hypothetical protein